MGLGKLDILGRVLGKKWVWVCRSLACRTQLHAFVGMFAPRPGAHKVWQVFPFSGQEQEGCRLPAGHKVCLGGCFACSALAKGFQRLHSTRPQSQRRISLF